MVHSSRPKPVIIGVEQLRKVVLRELEVVRALLLPRVKHLFWLDMRTVVVAPAERAVLELVITY